VLNAIKNLKNGKAAGIDDFVNEYFKYSSPQLVNIYCKLFNLAVNSGIDRKKNTMIPRHA
jgi:hypothetical protein